MYEREATFTADGCGAAFLAKNLSVFMPEPKADTVAAYIGRKAVHLLSWSDKLEPIRHDVYTVQRKTHQRNAMSAPLGTDGAGTQTSKESQLQSGQQPALASASSSSQPLPGENVAAASESRESGARTPSPLSFITPASPSAAEAAADKVASDPAVSPNQSFCALAASTPCFPPTSANLVTNGILMQVHVCRPTYCQKPILIVLSTLNVMIIDIPTRETIFTASTTKLKYESAIESGKRVLLTKCGFARGIECNDNTILVGCNSGDILVINCVGDTNFQLKKSLKEHAVPVVDIATCLYDGITVSADVGGCIVVWPRQLKSSSKKISTCQPISVINILRKQILCGTYNGQILLYSSASGELMAEVNAHSRQITAISVAPESAYILSASEDSNIRMWKLHTRKPEAFRIEYRFCEKYVNASLVGGAFSGTRGNMFVVAAYESVQLLLYHINRRPPKEGADEKAEKTNEEKSTEGKARDGDAAGTTKPPVKNGATRR